MALEMRVREPVSEFEGFAVKCRDLAGKEIAVASFQQEDGRCGAPICD